MFANTLQIQSLDELRTYVYENLCEQNQLEIGAFEMTERILVRSGQPCGIYFCVHGPRSVKLTAIWETDRNTILFYGCTGERLGKAQLAQTVAIQTAGAA